MANEPAAGAGTTEAGKGAGAPAAAAAAAAAAGATGAGKGAGDGAGAGAGGDGAGAGDGAGKGTAAATAAAGGTAASDSGGKDGAGNPKPKAPDSYTLTVPKGAEDYLDATDLERHAEIAKANDWSNEEAQAYTEAVADAVAEQSAAFRARTESDTTWGGKKLAETQAFASRFLDRIAPKGDPLGDEFRSILVKTGYGNNLAVIAAMARGGKMMAEDGGAGAGSAGGGNRTAAEILYPEGGESGS